MELAAATYKAGRKPRSRDRYRAMAVAGSSSASPLFFANGVNPKRVNKKRGARDAEDMPVLHGLVQVKKSTSVVFREFRSVRTSRARCL
jgi:hypothetical protein